MSFLVQQGAWEATQNKWKYGNEAGLVGAAIEDSAARLTQQIEQSNRQVAGAIGSLAAQINSGLAGVEASLDHGFSQVLAAIGIMQESLEELVRLAANPAKTAAYEHFVEARDAFENGWYQDCQEQLNKAMEGVEGVSSGYKMEWRFHYLKGLLYMGSNDNPDHEAMADLPLAEEGFLLAAKYAVKDLPAETNKNDLEITTEMVGTLHLVRNARVGNKIQIGQRLGVVEAMGIMNDIHSDVSGIITKIEVEDRQQVSYGQVLFKIGQQDTFEPTNSSESKCFTAASRVAEKMGGEENKRRALAHSKKAVEAAADYGEGHFQKARVHAQLNEIDETLFHVAKAGEITPVYYAKAIIEPSFKEQKTSIDAALDSVRAEVVSQLTEKVKKITDNYNSEIAKYSLENHPTIQRWIQISEEPTSLGLIEACGYRDLGLHADKIAFMELIEQGKQKDREEQEKLKAQQELHLQQQQWRDQQEATSCFPTTTRILTPTGHREIGDIEPGDTVLSTNASGQLVRATVTAKKSYGASPITRIILDGESRDLRTTAHHSFKTDSGWKRASQLQAGDTLLRVDDSGNSQLVRIKAITTEAPEPVFNLYTTGPHNFIAEGVLAHNFTELRWLRTWAHRLVVDPFHSGVVEGVEV